MSEHEELVPGQVVVRSDDGKFAPGGSLSRERAAAIASGPRSSKGSADGDELSDALLAAVSGGPDEREAAKALLIRRLAALASSNKPHSVRAIEALASVLGEFFAQIRAPQSWERCRVCGRDDNSRPINVMVGGKLAEAIAAKYGMQLLATPPEGPS